MASSVTKGTLVDVPLALTEGFRNAPRIYGGEVRKQEKVTDWKIGGIVAGKVLRFAFFLIQQ
jgi:sterol 3beta-glucosyltransferase